MLPGIDKELKRELFSQVDPTQEIWIGPIHELVLGRELVPLKFATFNYLVIFSSPAFEAGDQDVMMSMSQFWADGFCPEPNSRVIKFCRADAEVDFFKPEKWELSNRLQIFQFLETLAEAIALHATGCKTVSQYFFWPASKGLEVTYRRAFRHLDRTCLPGQFVPILEPIGVFDGYQRT